MKLRHEKSRWIDGRDGGAARGEGCTVFDVGARSLNLCHLGWYD